MDQPSAKLRVAAMIATVIALLAISVPFVWQHEVDAEPVSVSMMSPVASHAADAAPARDDGQADGAACMADAKPAKLDFTMKDLDGKKLAGGPGTAIHDTISVLLEAAGAQNAHITWVAVSPQLFSPMLRRGEVDGIGAFDNAQVPALIGLGVKREEIGLIRYSDFGADLYGLALVTTKKFADENPSTVRGVVSALAFWVGWTMINTEPDLAELEEQELVAPAI